MTTAWVLPAGSDDAPGATEGDYALRPAGAAMEVGVRDEGWTWIGTLPAGSLPVLTDVQSAAQAPDQETVLRAVRGFASAQENRGG